MTHDKLEELLDIAKKASLLAGEKTLQIYNLNDFSIDQLDLIKPNLRAVAFR